LLDLVGVFGADQMAGDIAGDGCGALGFGDAADPADGAGAIGRQSCREAALRDAGTALQKVSMDKPAGVSLQRCEILELLVRLARTCAIELTSPCGFDDVPQLRSSQLGSGAEVG
jgi:hypothetical protein